MRKYRAAATAVILVLTMVLATGCTTFDNFKTAFFSEEGAKSDTIKIGVLEPQTGNDSKGGELEIRGIELAKTLKPELLGKEVELIYADTQSSIYTAESAVADLIDKEPVLVLGSYGDAVSLTAGQQFKEAGIPAISITAANPLITANNPYYFRMTFTEANQGRALAGYTVEKLKQNRAAVVCIADDDVTAETVSRFKRQMKALTGSDNAVSATLDIDLSQTNFEEEIKALKESGAKTVFMPVSIEIAEKFFAAMEKAKLTGFTVLATKDWHSDEVIELQKKFPAVRIAVASDFTGVMTKNTEKTSLHDTFVKAYKEKYDGREPEEASALAFDAYMIAAQAIEKGGDGEGKADREKVKEALLLTENFNGASGSITFDENGDPKKTINVDLIRKGRFVSVYTAK